MSVNFSDMFSSADFNINNPKLEELLNKTKDVAETVGRKSVERLDISKKKIEALDTKTKLAKAYEKFGEMQYRAFLGEETELADVEAAAAEISALKDKLDVLNVEIEEAKASFNDSVSNMAQKTKEAFHKATSTDSSVEAKVEVEVVEATDADAQDED